MRNGKEEQEVEEEEKEEKEEERRRRRAKSKFSRSIFLIVRRSNGSLGLYQEVRNTS